VQDQYAFCVIVARLTGSLIRKEDLSTGDFLVSGNFNAAPNETLANHRRRLSNHWLDLGLRVNRGFWGANDLYYWRASRRRKRFVVRADEKLTAFVELQRAIHEFAGEFDLLNAIQISIWTVFHPLNMFIWTWKHIFGLLWARLRRKFAGETRELELDLWTRRLKRWKQRWKQFETQQWRR